MATIIELKNSDVAGKVPLVSDLELGELAVNTADGKVFLKKTDDTIVSLGDNELTGTLFLIPTDFPDLQSAFSFLSGYNIPLDTTVEVRIEAGHVPDTGLMLVGGDYSRISITSEDRPQLVSSALQTPLFHFETCTAPTLDTLFDMRNVTANVIGYAAYKGAIGVVTPTNGVIYAPGSGLYAENSRVEAQGSNFNNASNVSGESSGISAWEGAVINADGAQASSGWVGVNAGFGGTINFMGGTAINNTRHNIRAREQGNINCQGATCYGAGAYNIYSWKASVVNAREANAQNAGEIGVFALEGSVVSARGVNTNGSLVGLRALQSSKIDAPFSTNNNCGDTAVLADSLSEINVETAEGTGAVTRSIYANQCSKINARGFNGTGGVEIRADSCSHINGIGAQTPRFRVETGSTISTSGGATSNITPNTITSSGIIFQ